MAQVVSSKLDDELFDRFETKRRQIGMTRSTLLRLLIREWLGDDLRQAALEEAYFATTGAVRRATKRALDDMHESLPRYLAEESGDE